MKILKILLILTIPLLFSGCTFSFFEKPKPKVVVKTVTNIPKLPILKNPKPIKIKILKRYANGTVLVNYYDLIRLGKAYTTARYNCMKYRKVNVSINSYIKRQKAKNKAKKWIIVA